MARTPDPKAERAKRKVELEEARRNWLRGWWMDLVGGTVLVAVGAIVLLADMERSTWRYVAIYAPLVLGMAAVARGTWRLVQWLTSLGSYKRFVAWRYLLVPNRKVKPVYQHLLLAALGALGAIALARLAGIVPDAIHSAIPLVVLALVVLILVVEFVGILPASKPAFIVALVGLIGFVLSMVARVLISQGKVPYLHLDPEEVETLSRHLLIAAIIAAALCEIGMFFGTLRSYFTFFTTVPIGGVWIGTSARVVVLSVMGGFESDLRQKILGSNAHIQITREDGDFVEWREVKARVDQMPGVIASTPYAVSEVVVAANNTGMNVIIKGIDPKTVGKVTDLVSDLEDRDAMKRLEPIVSDAHDLRVPQQPRGSQGAVIDPPPADMPSPGEPIDFSAPAPAPAPSGNGGDTDGSGGSATGGGSAGKAGTGAHADGAAFGGDAVRILGEGDPPPAPPRDLPPPGATGALEGAPDSAPKAVVDPPPPDLITSDEPPADYSRPDYLQDAIKVIDPPFDTPSISRRTQSLPGILVGRELVKQTHLYTGEEVRVVSPLSDPANPDATGTPIPFNRDYRVAGTFFTGMYEYDLKYVYVTLESLQEFLDRGDAVDGIEIRVANPYETDAFVADFQAAFGKQYRVQDWKELNRSLFSALKLEKIMMFVVLGIVILVASFSIVGNLIMVVVEKAREIALLKTLGASDLGVLQVFSIQGLMVGAIGTLLGMITGLLLCWALATYGFPLNADVYYIDRLPVHVDPWSVAATAAAGVIISILATLYPAVVAARVRPAAGMRH